MVLGTNDGGSPRGVVRCGMGAPPSGCLPGVILCGVVTVLGDHVG